MIWKISKLASTKPDQCSVVITTKFRHHNCPMVVSDSRRFSCISIQSVPRCFTFCEMPATRCRYSPANDRHCFFSHGNPYDQTLDKGDISERKRIVQIILHEPPGNSLLVAVEAVEQTSRLRTNSRKILPRPHLLLVDVDTLDAANLSCLVGQCV
jgi:hypothetical protein